MKLSHRVIIYTSIGFGYGVLAGVVISALMSPVDRMDGAVVICTAEFIKTVGNPVVALLLQLIATGLYGAVCMGGSAIYSIERWSLLKCTLIHYFGVMGLYVIMALFLRWYSKDNIFSLFIMIGAMTVIYILIWLGNYISYSIGLKKINRELRDLKAAEHE